MTSIKCRYTIPYCTYPLKTKRIRHFEVWWCDSTCEYDGVYTKPLETPKHNGVEILNPQCVYCKYKTGEFEKSVKRYSYEGGVLSIAGRTYYENEIDYLEIDGRIIINVEA